MGFSEITFSGLQAERKRQSETVRGRGTKKGHVDCGFCGPTTLKHSALHFVVGSKYKFVFFYDFKRIPMKDQNMGI